MAEQLRREREQKEQFSKEQEEADERDQTRRAAFRVQEEQKALMDRQRGEGWRKTEQPR